MDNNACNIYGDYYSSNDASPLRSSRYDKQVTAGNANLVEVVN
ncbi:MAG: hypothetical protein WAX07_05570 [Candidatus Altiarchaeia archaeon]